MFYYNSHRKCCLKFNKLRILFETMSCNEDDFIFFYFVMKQEKNDDFCIEQSKFVLSVNQRKDAALLYLSAYLKR